MGAADYSVQVFDREAHKPTDTSSRQVAALHSVVDRVLVHPAVRCASEPLLAEVLELGGLDSAQQVIAALEAPGRVGP